MVTAAEVVATVDLGTATAAKRGRNPRWPYVPLVLHPEYRGHRRQEQIKGLAYATRQEAVDAAQRHLDAERALLARKLADPRYRALRESYGLPRELAQ